MSIPLPRPYRPILGALTMASVLSVAPVACGETAADDTTADDTAATTSTPETTGTDGADEHDTDQSTADEHDTDHGDGDDAGEHPAGNGSTVHGLGDLDVELLHDLDDQLAAGALDAEAQRAVVAELMEAVEALEPSDGSEEAELLDLVRQLDEALAAADLEAAAPLATEAHELAHELQHGEHG